MTRLNTEQEALIPAFQDKWRYVALSLKPINPSKVTAAIQQVYAAMGKKSPAISFFPSPKALKIEVLNQPTQQLAEKLGAPLLMMPLSLELLGEIQGQLSPELWQDLQRQWQLSEQSLPLIFQPMTAILQQLGSELSPKNWETLRDLQECLRSELITYFWQQQQNQIREQVIKQPGGELLIQWGDNFWSQIAEPLWKTFAEPALKEIANQSLIQEIEQEIKEQIIPWLEIIDGIGFGYSVLRPNIDISYIAQIDYCISVLKCQHDRQKWQALQALAQDCAWVFMFEKTCIVCDQPSQLLFDTENRLHGEGEPAIQFPDGYQLYAYQNVILPEKYGQLHPHQWQSRWLLTETNAEIRRVLIQGIGYGRLCLELGAIELDSWREYTLLRIESDVDLEPIYLLKMTCPSTGHIHALRVPPTTTSAREAIRWVNWGVDPEDFSTAT
jgi:hypothetical protein